ncbi:hypothetical protein [Stakelama marina]|uniref:Uncharacterized protein n=1 Tax=Stakelama marina TaxID=2826939 RepID=A0A8T4I9Q4_9SPHN|nr:hypothetical protein [Stakelama marina]MBR0551083.1 hypothetical protein [Stakelama marina]
MIVGDREGVGVGVCKFVTGAIDCRLRGSSCAAAGNGIIAATALVAIRLFRTIFPIWRA